MGYISKKKIHGKDRFYHQWTEDGRVRSKYLREGEKEPLEEQIQKRNHNDSKNNNCYQKLQQGKSGIFILFSPVRCCRQFTSSCHSPAFVLELCKLRKLLFRRFLARFSFRAFLQIGKITLAADYPCAKNVVRAEKHAAKVGLLVLLALLIRHTEHIYRRGTL